MVVVTGATGHIGNNLVRALLARGEKVRCLVLPSDDLRPLEGLAVQVVEGDVRQPESLIRAFKGAEVVYHLASIVAITPGRSRLLEEVNVRGARNVANACLECGVRRMVYTSSIHALVEPPIGTVMDEAMPFDPARTYSEYGKSKARGALEVLDAAARGLNAVIVNPTGVIGPYDFRPSEMGQLFLDFARHRLGTYVDGAYDFVDVRDVAAGHISATENGRTGEN